MRTAELFKAQRKLDERIVKEKGLEGQDLLPKKILALQVELGELANEWRGFKFWSNNQEPNVLESKCIYCHTLYVEKVEYCEGCYEEYEKHFPVTVNNPLLEEYVDCLHFILSIGNDAGYEFTRKDMSTCYQNIQQCINDIYMNTSTIADECWADHIICERLYKDTFRLTLHLGEMLGFTWEQIEQAYYAKNEINHDRQENGY